MPGMAKDNTVREEEVNMVINGEICPDAIVSTMINHRMYCMRVRNVGHLVRF